MPTEEKIMAMRYSKSLYQNNLAYRVHHFKSRADWLQGRGDIRGVGGSDAAAAIGRSPWKTNVELWRQKTGRSTAPDISNSQRVQDGIDEEDPIRRLFQVETRNKYEVQYIDNVILQSNEKDWMLYSPDGLLIEKATGKKGVLEIKTTEIMKSFDREKWGTRDEPRIPDNYYIQVLHGLNVTGFEFVVLYARLKNSDGSLIFRAPDTYRIDRDDAEDDLKIEADGVKRFWDSIISDKEPDLILPEI